jgi:hypothetical protein
MPHLPGYLAKHHDNQGLHSQVLPGVYYNSIAQWQQGMPNLSPEIDLETIASTR